MTRTHPDANYGYISRPLSERRHDSLIKDRPEVAAVELLRAMQALAQNDTTSESKDDVVIGGEFKVDDNTTIVFKDVPIEAMTGGWGWRGDAEQSGVIEVHVKEGDKTKVLTMKKTSFGTTAFDRDGIKLTGNSEPLAQEIYDLAEAVERQAKEADEEAEAEGSDVDTIKDETSGDVGDLGVV